MQGLGEKGRIFGLEVNFRPPGGFCPDLMNYAGELDVYRLWAEVILKQSASYSKLRRYSAGFVGRRNSIKYRFTVKEVEEMYKEDMIEVLYLPEAFAAAMGDVAIVAKFTSPARRDEFFKTALRRKDRL